MSIEDSNNEGLVSWKTLVLMIPEGAIKWGIYTEAPVLTSPILNRSLKCSGCQHPYRPLVYRPGVVRPDNFCDQDCGIYYWSDKPNSAARRFKEAAWVAILEPIGRVVGSNLVVNRRAETVLVTQLGGVCDDVRCRGILRNGILFSSHKPDFLTPLCEDHGLNHSKAVFTFRVTENGLVFSPLRPPPE